MRLQPRWGTSLMAWNGPPGLGNGRLENTEALKSDRSMTLYCTEEEWPSRLHDSDQTDSIWRTLAKKRSAHSAVSEPF